MIPCLTIEIHVYTQWRAYGATRVFTKFLKNVKQYRVKLRYSSLGQVH